MDQQDFNALDADATVFQADEIVDGELVPPLTKAQLVAHCEGDTALAYLLLAAADLRHPGDVLARAGGPEAFLARFDNASILRAYGTAHRFARATCTVDADRFDIDLPDGFDSWIAANGIKAVRGSLSEAVGHGAEGSHVTATFSPAASDAIGSTLPKCLQAFSAVSDAAVATVRGTRALHPAATLALVQSLSQILGRVRVAVGERSWLDTELVVARHHATQARIQREIESAAASGYRVEPVPKSETGHGTGQLQRYRHVRPDGRAAGFHRAEREAWMWAAGDCLGHDALAPYEAVLHGQPLDAASFARNGPTVGTILHDWRSGRRAALVYDHLARGVYHATDLPADTQVGQTYWFERHHALLQATWIPLAVGEAIATDARSARARQATSSARHAQDSVQAARATDGLHVLELRADPAHAPIILGHVHAGARSPYVRPHSLRSWADAAIVAQTGIPLAYPLRALNRDLPSVDLAFLQVAAFRTLGAWLQAERVNAVVLASVSTSTYGADAP